MEETPEKTSWDIYDPVLLLFNTTFQFYMAVHSLKNPILLHTRHTDMYTYCTAVWAQAAGGFFLEERDGDDEGRLKSTKDLHRQSHDTLRKPKSVPAFISVTKRDSRKKLSKLCWKPKAKDKKTTLHKLQRVNFSHEGRQKIIFLLFSRTKSNTHLFVQCTCFDSYARDGTQQRREAQHTLHNETSVDWWLDLNCAIYIDHAACPR